MKIDFNNVRRQAISNFTGIVEELNSRMYDTSNGKIITIETSRIQENMDDLRNCLVAIGATYNENDPEFICVLDEKTTIPEFNPTKENNESNENNNQHR